MPQRPDGAAARPQRVTFTKGSAERIAAVVRDYEAGDRGAEPLRFGTVTSDARKTFRIATFSGAWSIGATKTVTFKYQTATPNTAVATNLFAAVPSPTGTADCAIAKEGTAWFLVAVPMVTATQAVVTDVQVAATLNTSNCQITVQRTLTSSVVSLVRFKTS